VHEMWPIAIDNPGVCQSISLSVWLSFACGFILLAERIEVQLGVETLSYLRNVVSNGHPAFPPPPTD